MSWSYSASTSSDQAPERGATPPGNGVKGGCGNRSNGYVSETGLFNVEICATLLTDKPPKLPLREELPSLGFEIIYNGDGVGSRTVQYEAERAVKRFRRHQEMLDKEKLRNKLGVPRLFPRSKRSLQRKLDERKLIESELRMPHAFSYESYELQLYEDGLMISTDESSSTSSGSDSGSGSTSGSATASDGGDSSSRFTTSNPDASSAASPASSSKKKKMVKAHSRTEAKKEKKVAGGSRTKGKRKKRKRWGNFFLRKTKSADDSCDLGGNATSLNDLSSIASKTTSIGEVLSEAAFNDILAPDQDDSDDGRNNNGGGGLLGFGKKKGGKQQQQPNSGRNTLSTGGTATMSGATSSVNPASSTQESSGYAGKDKKKVGGGSDGLHDMEIQFKSKRQRKPELDAVDEGGSGSSNSRDDKEETSSSSSSSNNEGGGKTAAMDDSVRDAFASFNDSARDAFADLDLDLDLGPKAAAVHGLEGDDDHRPADDAAVKAAFEDFDSTSPVYEGEEGPANPPGGARRERADPPATEDGRMGGNDDEEESGENDNSSDNQTSAGRSSKEEGAIGDASSCGEECANNDGKQTAAAGDLSVGDAFEGLDSNLYANPDAEHREEVNAEGGATGKDENDVIDVEKLKRPASKEVEERKEDAVGPNSKPSKPVSFSNKLIETLNDGMSVSVMTDDHSDGAVDGASCGSVKTLFEAIACTNTPAREIEGFISSFPDAAKVREEETARLPLHVLCDRGMPDRARIEPENLTGHLVRDIASYKHTISVVFSTYTGACHEKDRNGDLPIHLLAKTLMKWEAVWYETVYTQASKDSDQGGKTSADISKLYQGMSETVGILLEPFTSSASLCHEAGGTGRLLPLHIACIFTSSVRTLRLILEAYPEAARIPCDLGGLQTFVPDKSMPLELHEGLSTDFPKWESEAKHERYSNIDWSEPKAGKPHPDDSIRRSDLLFAYNPNIEPYRFEKTRVRRLESRIRFNATKSLYTDGAQMEHAARLLWVWMCTFQEETNHRPTYAKSVQRVVDGLSIDVLRQLAAFEVADGKPLVEVANAQCAKIIRRSLGDHTAAVATAKPKSEEPPKPEKASENMFKDVLESPLPVQGRMGVTLLSRRIFNIREESFPTSFVILPYRLARTPDGKLGMASADSAQTALKFAEYLLRLTDPRSILYFLDTKSIKQYDQSIYEAADDESARQEAYMKIRDYEAGLLALYGHENAFMYLIDEVTGIPVVPESGGSYPIVLRDPSNMVQKLLPMMLVGMILMRGDKALAVLTNVLLDDSVTIVPPSWILAAKDLYVYLQPREGHEIDSGIDVPQVQSRLKTLIMKADSKKRRSERPKNGSTEWNVELSILKMLTDMNDEERLFCDLRAEHFRGKGVIWGFKEETPGDAIVNETETSPKGEKDVEFPDALVPFDEPAETAQDPMEPDGDIRTDQSPQELGPMQRDDDTRSDLSLNGYENSTVDTTSVQSVQSILSVQSQRTARVEEVRRRFDAVIRGREQSSYVPDVDELSQKHEELTKQYENMAFEHSSESSTSVLFRFPQPANDSSDEENKPRLHGKPLVEVNEYCSSDEEAIRQIINDKRITDRLPIKVYESSDDDLAKRGFEVSVSNRPPRSKSPVRTKGPVQHRRAIDKPVIRITEEEDASADELKEGKAFCESSGDEKTDYRSDFSRASNEDIDIIRRKRHSLLFHELSFMDTIEEESREPTDTMRAIGNESARVWQEITSQLDNSSGMYLEDTQVIRLKAQLAQEAKRLSFMNKRVKILEREKDLMIETEKNGRLGVVVDPVDIDYRGFDESLRKARQLLVRLCTLEDRLLIDEIEIQHLTLESHSLDGEIEKLRQPSPRQSQRPRSPSKSPRSRRSANSKASASRTSPKAVSFRDPPSYRGFDAHRDCAHGAYDCDFPLSEIDLAKLDASRPYSSAYSNQHSGLRPSLQGAEYAKYSPTTTRVFKF